MVICFLEKYKTSQESLVVSRLSYLKNKAQSIKNKLGIAEGDGLQKSMDIKNGAEAPSIINISTLYSIIYTLLRMQPRLLS